MGRNYNNEFDGETGTIAPPPRVYTDEDRRRSHERRQALHERIFDQDAKKPFRNAYTFKVGYDFSSLKPFCENIIMVTDGLSDHINNTRMKLVEGLKEYDSDKDVIVLAGRSIDTFLTGQIIAGKVAQKAKPYQSYAVAVFLNPNYIFYEVFLDPAIETHEIRTR